MSTYAVKGPERTPAVIKTVRARLAAGGIEHLVVATTSGKTAVEFAKALSDLNAQLVAVTHHVGFREGDLFELEPDQATALSAAGATVVTCSHALSGVGRSISRTFGGVTAPELVAHTLRMFGQGMKVCVEIAIMAADAGAIPTDRDVLCVGGTGRGADTAIVLRPAHANNVFEMRIREILCLPRGE
ncbi:pyruvate kinase alpha/beta domain-containing protein [Candidatus Bipolaricaulota bacterium]